MISPALGFGALDRVVVVQAETGLLGSDYVTASADGATYVTAGTDFAATAAPGTASKVASYTVTFPQPGTYHLYIRLRIGPAGGSDDSFYYGTGFGVKGVTDAAGWTLVNNITGIGYTAPTETILNAGTAGMNVWKWLKLSTNNFGEAGAVFVVPAGALTQTFQFGTRENGLDVDQFAFALAGSEYLVAHFSNTRPVIDGGQIFTVAEGADNGTVIGTVLATDPDPATVLKNWTIVGGAGAAVFSIDADTGVLSLDDGAGLNSEVTPSYDLSLTVDDAVSTSGAQMVTVNVEKPQSILVSGPLAGRYGLGQTLSFTVLLGRNMIVDTTAGVPTLSVVIGDDARAASYVSGSGTNRLVFSYAVQSGDEDSDGIAVASPIEL
ncbi:MAG TPA: cadherin repeat domain-containing protein, partial [Opitutus sp.]|nr:cadherin repeat domain-containing protein [Opitutus sp.]